MKIILASIELILCLIALSCAVPINELRSDGKTAILPEFVTLDNGIEENGKRATRQVAVNVGPIGVGVGPFGGVGVRIGRFFNLGVAPSYPIAYPPPVPVAYRAPVPVAYPGEYSYSSNYNYNYFY